jgi:hypothetical protein
MSHRKAIHTLQALARLASYALLRSTVAALGVLIVQISHRWLDM